METKTKLYVGTAKQKTINTKFGEMEVVKISYSKKDLELMMANLNEKGWVNLDQTKRKEVGKYGETHSMVIDLWKPTTPPANTPEKKQTDRNGIVTEDDSSLPF